MNLRTTIAISLAAATLLLSSCKSATGSDSAQATDADTTRTTKILGEFSADSAYNHIAAQVAFGPRVPGTDAHRACRDYIIDRLKGSGIDSMIVQEGVVTAYNGDRLPISNIIVGYNINQSRRVVLACHWDTRPWADMENTMEDRNRPIPGANDGGSGVGVMLEIARNLAIRKPSIGVDLIFFDAEDYGEARGFGRSDDTWCLGSQYWADNLLPYNADNLPLYGILLDMVGGKNAKFHYEDFSFRNARTPTIKVWSEAQRLGFGDRFISRPGGAVIDDHVIMTRMGIPTTDIIEISNEETGSFNPTWHTHRDNLANIDKSTLNAVGTTVLNVLYKEKPF